MALDIYYKENIANAIKAAKAANDNAPKAGSDSEYLEGYDDGFNAALGVIALAFGVLSSEFFEVKG